MFINYSSKFLLSNRLLRCNIRLSQNCYSFSNVNSQYILKFQHQLYLPNHLTVPFTVYSLPNIRNYSSGDKKVGIPESRTENIESTVSEQSSVNKVSQRTKLKQAIKDYGSTIVVFHVAISLASLGICYAAISNGVDAISLLTFLGFSESVISSKVAVGGSTFVMAYAVHKLFAPVRIGITLSTAPFIVRYLRKINWLKPPKKTV